MAGKSEVSRRGFLRRAGAAGAWVAIVPLAGCGGGKPQPRDDETPAGDSPIGDPPAGDSPAPNSADGTSPAADPCADLSDLSPEARDLRDDAGYVAKTPDPAERCDNCEYWEPPATGKPCGGCTVLAGPIHPAGYCDLWEEQS